MSDYNVYGLSEVRPRTQTFLGKADMKICNMVGFFLFKRELVSLTKNVGTCYKCDVVDFVKFTRKR
jgi:hypothetical protein